MKAPTPVVATAAMLLAAMAAAQVPMSAGQQERLDGEDPVEKKYQITFETTQHKQYCKAQVWTEYLQKNTVAAVNGGIINEDCGPSSGEFAVSVRFKDENGEVHNLEFVEQWQREDDQEILFDNEYFMGENVDLIRARARKVVCVCTESEEDAEEADKGEEE
jgi:hypothetical protein